MRWSWSGETVARQAAAVEGSRLSHRGGRDSSQRGMPQECIQQIAGHGSVGGVRRARPPCCWTPTTRLALDQTISALDQTISADSANFFIEANTGRGSDGELLRFPELGGVLARRFRLSLRAYVSKKEDDTELDFACEAVMNRASEHNVVALLDKWSTCWKHRGRTRAIGLHAYEKYSTLGFFGHGGVFGILRASQMKQACIAVNHFLRERFPTQTWTSIAVLYNPSMPLHRRRRVWLEDENGQQRHCWKQKAVKNSCAERGLTCMTRPFRSSRKHHMLKKHRGNMWALAAYTPQAYKHAHESHVLNSANSLGSCVYRGVSRVVTAK
eukprot:s4987_g8.t1